MIIGLFNAHELVIQVQNLLVFIVVFICKGFISGCSLFGWSLCMNDLEVEGIFSQVLMACVYVHAQHIRVFGIIFWFYGWQLLLFPVSDVIICLFFGWALSVFVEFASQCSGTWLHESIFWLFCNRESGILMHFRVCAMAVGRYQTS
ncbi:hypothetical protein SDJN03_19184, partial [Cucurbita argyrosperma subsp. sororia]